MRLRFVLPLLEAKQWSVGICLCSLVGT